MQALHRDDDEALGVNRDGSARCCGTSQWPRESDFGIRVIGLDRIVEDKDVAAAAGQRAADGGGKTIAPPGRLEFGLGRSSSGLSRVRGKTRL